MSAVRRPCWSRVHPALWRASLAAIWDDRVPLTQWRAMAALPCANVLVVDDDRDTVEAIAVILEAEGHTCTKARSGKEALELCKSKKFDCMLLDVTLGDTSGIAVAKALAQTPDIRPRHVVLLSGHPKSDFLSELRNGLVDGFISKPADIHILAEAVQSALARA